MCQLTVQRIRQPDCSRRPPSVCGAPKCHKGAAWAAFLNPESEEGATVRLRLAWAPAATAFAEAGASRGSGGAPPPSRAALQCSRLRVGERASRLLHPESGAEAGQPRRVRGSGGGGGGPGHWAASDFSDPGLC